MDILTREEWHDTIALLSQGPELKGSALVSGDAGHLEEHEYMRKLHKFFATAPYIKIKKEWGAFLLDGTRIGLYEPGLSPESAQEYYNILFTPENPDHNFFMVVSKDGLSSMPLAEWSDNDEAVLYQGGIYSTVVAGVLDSETQSQGLGQRIDSEKARIDILLQAIKPFFTVTNHVTIGSGQWEPPMPPEGEDHWQDGVPGTFYILHNANGNAEQLTNYIPQVWREGHTAVSFVPKQIPDITDLVSEIETLEGSNGALSTTVSGLETDVSTLTADKETLEGKVSTLESDNATLNTTVSGLETDLGSLSSANDTLSSTVSTLEGNVATLTSDKETLEGQVSSLESSNGTLSSTVSTLESTVGNLTSDKEALEGQVSTLESTIADLTSRLEALENPTNPE